MSTNENDNSIKTDVKRKKLNFEFIKVSYERVVALIPHWGSTPTGVLQNLVAFAIEAIDYASDRNLIPFVPGKRKLFDSFNYYQRLGEEFIYTAHVMNLPEPQPGNVSAWIIDVAYASLQNESLESTIPQSNFKHLLDAIIIGNALIQYCSRRSIKVDFQPDNVHVWLGKIISKDKDVVSSDKYAVIGKELVRYCKSNGVALPDINSIPTWFNKNINNPDQSDCHDMLETLFNMKTLPDEETMTLLASRFRVLTRQLYKAYYLMHEHSDESDEQDKNENLNNTRI